MASVLPGNKQKLIGGRYEAIRGGNGEVAMWKDTQTGQLLSFEELVKQSEQDKRSQPGEVLASALRNPFDPARMGYGDNTGGVQMGMPMLPGAGLGGALTKSGPGTQLAGRAAPSGGGRPGLPAPEVPTYTPEVMPGNGMSRTPGTFDTTAGRFYDALPGASGRPGLPAPGGGPVGSPSPQFAPRGAGGLDQMQSAQLDAAAAQLGTLPQSPFPTRAALGLGAAGAGLGAAYMANQQDGQPQTQAQSSGIGRAFGPGGQPQQQAPTPAGMGAWGMPDALRQQPQQPPQPNAPGTQPHGRGAPPMGTAQGVQSGAPGAQATPMTHNVPYRPSGGGGARPAYDYYANMMGAADSNDAYYRDFINLREQARAHASQANAQGEPYKFVPVMDYKDNTLHLVNANGADVVLNMNSDNDKQEYLRMVGKLGIDPGQLREWTMRASRPLLRHMMPFESGAPSSPDFNRHVQASPSSHTPGAQPGSAQEPSPPQPYQTPKDYFRNRQIGSLDEGAGPSPVSEPRVQMPQMGAQSVFDYNASIQPSPAEEERRLGNWNYDTESPRQNEQAGHNAAMAGLQDKLGADLAKPAAKQMYRTRAAGRMAGR